MKTTPHDWEPGADWVRLNGTTFFWKCRNCGLTAGTTRSHADLGVKAQRTALHRPKPAPGDCGSDAVEAVTSR